MPAKVSDYIGKLRNAKLIHPLKIGKVIEEETAPDGMLFAKVFPLQSFYSVEGTSVATYKNRTESVDARKKNGNLKTFRDFYIVDEAVFETFLNEREADVTYGRSPTGTKAPKPAAFMDEELLASMTPEALEAHARALAEKRLSKPKRQVSAEQIKKMQAARGGNSKSPARKGSKK